MDVKWQVLEVVCNIVWPASGQDKCYQLFKNISLEREGWLGLFKMIFFLNTLRQLLMNPHLLI